VSHHPTTAGRFFAAGGRIRQLLTPADTLWLDAALASLPPSTGRNAIALALRYHRAYPAPLLLAQHPTYGLLGALCYDIYETGHADLQGPVLEVMKLGSTSVVPGTGTALMEAAAAIAVEHGLHLSLIYEPDSLAFYTALGLRRTSRGSIRLLWKCHQMASLNHTAPSLL
jgi:hypothetical protein